MGSLYSRAVTVIAESNVHGRDKNMGVCSTKMVALAFSVLYVVDCYKFSILSGI